MSINYFREIGLHELNVNLNVGIWTKAEQTTSIMLGDEKLLMEQKPNLCIVVDDVTSTLAWAITAKKMLVSVAYFEGRIKSGDMTMPE
jgi:UDP-N-acetylglucosamine 2-epimerase (non-hydrolysing)